MAVNNIMPQKNKTIDGAYIRHTHQKKNINKNFNKNDYQPYRYPWSQAQNKYLCSYMDFIIVINFTIEIRTTKPQKQRKYVRVFYDFGTKIREFWFILSCYRLKSWIS